MDIVTVDLGGTHVRFAIATLHGPRVQALGTPTILHTGDFPSLAQAWDAYATQSQRPLPRAAGLAIACPIAGDTLKLTNSPWVIRPATLARDLGLDRLTLVNDFGAVAHAVAQLPDTALRHIAGPEQALPARGVISVIGPGTGLGVAQLLRRDGGAIVIETEGGHTDFAPVDSIDDAILAHLRISYPRVSAERIVSGPGLVHLYEYLAIREGRPHRMMESPTLWQAALDGTDSLAAMALQRFCMTLGSVAGDLVLAHGAQGLVIGGGIGARIAHMLAGSGFASRFVAKGRMEPMLARVPVKLITHPEPGLFGAAAAFAREHS